IINLDVLPSLLLTETVPSLSLGMFAGDGEEVRSVRSAPQGPSRRSRNHQMSGFILSLLLYEFQSAVQSSYDNDLKDETRDKHREFTFAMETQVVKIEKSHKEARKGTPRRVRLDEDDQDDRNELTLFLAGPSDSERKQISTNGVKKYGTLGLQEKDLRQTVLTLQLQTSSYVRRLEATVDMPRYSDVFRVPPGRQAIVREGGIPLLVETVDSGSQRGKENAASVLLQLCLNSPKFCTLVLQEGAIPPLVALSQSGTQRAKEKAQQLLSHFRNQRDARMKKGRS
ncbi:hypothetical protein DY000_02032675, partial [Brassica cretica]